MHTPTKIFMLNSRCFLVALTKSRHSLVWKFYTQQFFNTVV